MLKSQQHKGKVVFFKNTEGIIESDHIPSQVIFSIDDCILTDSIKTDVIVEFELFFINNSYCAKKIRVAQSTTMPGQVKQSKSPYHLENTSEFAFALHYIENKLKNIVSISNRFENPELIEDTAENFTKVIEDILYGEEPNIQTADIEDFNSNKASNPTSNRQDRDYWKDSFCMEEFGSSIEAFLSSKPSKGKKRYDFVWNEWNLEKQQTFTRGYLNENFSYSYIDKGETEQTHVYKQAPPNPVWSLTPIVQKGSTFFLSKAPVNQIAQSSYVPSLPPLLDIESTANRVLDPSLKSNEWQREVDAKRIIKISNFIAESGNIIANTPMIFIKDSSAASIENNELTIHFDKFLKLEKTGVNTGKLIDRKRRAKKDENGNIVYDDYRPLWLIDGQHRIKGIHRNEDEHQIEVPIIIFPSEFGMDATAKVFAEINTLQKKLDPLHELFMQHRFYIDHTNVKRKFLNYTRTTLFDAEKEGWAAEWEHSRANHLSYEILALLAKDGPLKDRIQFLKQNKRDNRLLVKADQWVNYARDWFFNAFRYRGEEIDNYLAIPDETIEMSLRELFFKEVKNYFDAWVQTCNHDEWTDNKNRWTNSSQNKSLLEKQTHFIILIELFNLTHRLAKEKKRECHEPGILRVSDFARILTPFKYVDWIHTDIINTYPGSGEKGRRSLEAWMSDALISGVQRNQDEVLDSNIKSKPGAGITSFLAHPEIEVSSSHSWPSKNNPIIVKSKRPWNARYVSKWDVWAMQHSGEEIQVIETKLKVSKHMPPLMARCSIGHQKIMDDSLKLRIRVSWFNSHVNPGVSEIFISNPNIG